METVVLNCKGSSLRRNHLQTYHISTIEDVPGDLSPGTPVQVIDDTRTFAGYGYYNPQSKLPLRILSFEEQSIDHSFWMNRLKQALNYRLTFYKAHDSFRLIFGDADGIPGLIVDKFSTHLVVQVTTAGIENYLNQVLDALEELCSPDSIVLACDSLPRKKEGLELYRTVARGKCPDLCLADIDGIDHFIDLKSSHKTGFFLDHRVNRSNAASYCQDRSVLDMFCFSGAFGIRAARNRATSVTAVDIHAPSLELGQKTADHHGLSDRMTFFKAEAFEFLATTTQQWDTVFLDPPSFVRGSRRARRNLSNYKKINTLGLQVTKPHGLYITSCCSFHVSRNDYLDVLSTAMIQSGRTGRIFHMGWQSPDHPSRPGVDGTDYLKCFFVKLDN